MRAEPGGHLLPRVVLHVEQLHSTTDMREAAPDAPYHLGKLPPADLAARGFRPTNHASHFPTLPR